VDERVFDVGMRTGETMRRLQQGVPPETAGRSAERAEGNGSLMRVLPLVL